MQNDKFDTFKVLLTEAFKELDAGKKQQHVTVVSRNGYNLSVNITLHSEYPEIVKGSEKKEFNEPNFLLYLPYEYGLDFTSEQLKDFYTHLKSVRTFIGLCPVNEKDAVFLFTDKEIILLMCEEFDNSGIN